ncbi:NAD(P)-dependent oxidoreductase [Promicromonospora iranensis]|uniref:NADH-flavin reductase n=1 Tax=Promicromonospora iranensis TaxID=1105144 RepID=A0ABU2CU17_9MICO|nr:NAD(P)H-binding protein [Promicromonospora iranensis]MDR7384840.1 putative NADH-flavin reductase [Promicromonospora iranensis]
MRIAVFGATGMVGSRVVDEAWARGHDVVAVSRRDAGNGNAEVETVSVDVRDAARVREVLRTADVAVSAVRPRPGEEATVPEMTTALLDAAVGTGTAVLLVGGAGPLASPGVPGRLVIDDETFVPAQWRSSAIASLAQLQACDGHPAAWTYLSPPAVLEPGTRTGVYRRGTTTLLVDEAGRSQISAEDLSVAVLDEVENPGGVRHFTVAY